MIHLGLCVNTAKDKELLNTICGIFCAFYFAYLAMGAKERR